MDLFIAQKRCETYSEKPSLSSLGFQEAQISFGKKNWEKLLGFLGVGSLDFFRIPQK